MHTHLSFMQHRAEELELVRRVPLPGYDITFLLTAAHLERFQRDRLVDFVCQVGRGWRVQLFAQLLLRMGGSKGPGTALPDMGQNLSIWWGRRGGS